MGISIVGPLLHTGPLLQNTAPELNLSPIFMILVLVFLSQCLPARI